MDMSDFFFFFNVIVCGICFGTGIILKNSLDFIPNKYIPLINGVLGIILNVWLNNWELTPQTIFEGLLSGLSSTGIFETLKNTIGLM